nr:MAG TPA: hypothetical protein [Caudoviricetes sp.]
MFTLCSYHSTLRSKLFKRFLVNRLIHSVW